MKTLSFKKTNIKQLPFTLQIILIISYLTINIINTGKMGSGLVLLAGFVAIAGLDVFIKLTKGHLRIKLHFFIFLLFVAWLSFRVIVDLQDLDHLKQLTVATTGGVLLFFLLGTFTRGTLDNINSNRQINKFLQLMLVICFFVIFIKYKNRLVRTDIFLIDGLNDDYQRPGNFMIILFLLSSCLHLSIVASFINSKFINLLVWLSIYSFGMLCLLISSQMIGSNAATANILAFYLMTIVISFLGFNKTIRTKFLTGKLALPLSKTSLKKIIKYSSILIAFGIIAVIIVIQIANFDLSKTRVFGFESGENSSVTSRFDILKETGMDQMGYAPLFGNINVAYLVTGNAGRTLHNFIPNIIAELGFIGLIIILVLFIFIIKILLNRVKNGVKLKDTFSQTIINFWLLFLLLFLFLYANISVGKSWAVMWFFLGFAVSVFETKNN